MANEPKTLEIGSMPEVLRIVNEVRKTRTPRVLSRRKKPLAVLQPLNGKRKRTKRAKTRKDYEAFLASAGGWKDLVDTEKLKRDIYESRMISTRPPVTL